MSIKSKKFKIADSYLSLIREFPLRPIRSHEEYDVAAAVVQRLALRGENDLDVGETDYLDALSEFISIYDRKHFSLGQDNRTPLERLKYILSESQTTPAMLKDILGCSQPMVSMILGGRRDLSKQNIRAICSYFKVDTSYLM